MFTLVFAVAVPGVGAQQISEAHVGDRVRFHRAPDDRLVIAQLTRLTRDSVTYVEFCDDCRAVTVGHGALSQVELSSGRTHGVSRTLIGTATGAAVGAGGWLLFVLATTIGCHEICGMGVVFTPAAAVIGGGVGGILGWRWNTERWVPASLAGS